MSPLQMRSLSNAPTGFTFSSNITSSVQSTKDRESYEYFLNTMEEDYWKSVSTIRTTYFFDGIGRGGGFLAVGFRALDLCHCLVFWDRVC